MIIIFHR